MPFRKRDRIGILDIGSNSVRFMIYELYGAAFSPVYNEKVLAGLGRELKDTQNLSPDGKRLALEALKRFKKIADAQNLSKVLVAATAAMRLAHDAKPFIKQVRQETGLDISPISGKEEARLTASGLIAGIPDARGIAADLGGASLELIHVDDKNIWSGKSYPLGPFTVLGSDLRTGGYDDVATLKTRIEKVISKKDHSENTGQPLYLIGGAWRNLARVHQERTQYPMRTLQAYEVAPDVMQSFARWVYGEGRDEVMQWSGISARRAETLPFGAIMLDVLISRLKPSVVIISSTGLREGLIYDSFSKSQRKRDALFDGCRDFASGNLKGKKFAKPLYNFLKPAAKTFPKCFDVRTERRIRKAACQLVGTGKGLHPDYQAELTFENVLYAPLSGLDHKERAYLSLILFSSFTSSAKTPNDAALNLLLTPAEQHSARCYGTAIRLAVVTSGRSNILLKTCRLEITTDGEVQVIAEPGSECLLTERVDIRRQKLSDMLAVTFEPIQAEFATA